MGWEKIDFKGYWFDLPKRSGGWAINEFFAVRGGYLLEDNGSCYMMPRQYSTSLNSEYWIGILQDNKQLVHCLNPERFRVIEEDNSNILVESYLKEGHPAFYSIETVKIIDLENGNAETEKMITSLMQPQEIIDFCNGWVGALNQYEEEVFDVSMGANKFNFTKRNQIEYFSGNSKNMTEELKRYNDAIKA